MLQRFNLGREMRRHTMNKLLSTLMLLLIEITIFHHHYSFLSGYEKVSLHFVFTLLLLLSNKNNLHMQILRVAAFQTAIIDQTVNLRIRSAAFCIHISLSQNQNFDYYYCKLDHSTNILCSKNKGMLFITYSIIFCFLNILAVAYSMWVHPCFSWGMVVKFGFCCPSFVNGSYWGISSLPACRIIARVFALTFVLRYWRRKILIWGKERKARWNLACLMNAYPLLNIGKANF